MEKTEKKISLRKKLKIQGSQSVINGEIIVTKNFQQVTKGTSKTFTHRVESHVNGDLHWINSNITSEYELLFEIHRCEFETTEFMIDLSNKDSKTLEQKLNELGFK